MISDGMLLIYYPILSFLCYDQCLWLPHHASGTEFVYFSIQIKFCGWTYKLIHFIYLGFCAEFKNLQKPKGCVVEYQLYFVIFNFYYSPSFFVNFSIQQKMQWATLYAQFLSVANNIQTMWTQKVYYTLLNIKYWIFHDFGH